MNNPVLPQQDFFLYVSALRDVEEIQLQCGGLEAGGQVAVRLPEVFDNWVQIPIEGKLTVYARVWDVEE